MRIYVGAIFLENQSICH